MFRAFSKIILIFCLTLPWTSEVLAVSAKINKLRLSTIEGKTRLVFVLSKTISYKVNLTHDEKQLDLLLENAGLGKKAVHKDFSAKNALVKSIDAINNNPRVNIKITLKQKVTFHDFIIKSPDRIVIDIAAKDDLLNQHITKVEPVFDAEKEKNIHKTFQSVEEHNEPDADSALNLPETSSVESKGHRKIIVVIDPGHGGKDPGAVGKRRTREKDVVFAISSDLKQAIDRIPGFHAVLTRKGDYFISLRQRLNIAHDYKADMFIAIHADAYRYHESRGASVFALSQKGATSEAARWLAEKENESELKEAMTDKSFVLKSVLLDLAQFATTGASLEIGEDILTKLSHFTHLHSHRVEQAAFVVLKSPDIPSLLVETGFISDAEEERLLNDSRYQKKLAAALAQGITGYFWQKPPPGTYLLACKRHGHLQ